MNYDIYPLGEDPAWLPHSVNLRAGVVEFVHLNRQTRGHLTFLTDEYINKGVPRRTISLEATRTLAAEISQNRCHFLFHSAFCCSTLIARAYDVPGYTMGLKEPAALLSLADAALGGTDIDAALSDILKLLSRPLEGDEVAIIKPTNVVNPIAEKLFAASPLSKALLLYAPLSTFLRSVAQKGLFGRIWARRNAAFLARRLEFNPGYSQAERWEHTDLQVAALAWLQQKAQFARLMRVFPKRVVTLDSESLIANPTEVLLALNRFFGLSLSEDWARAVAGGPVFKRDAKRHSQAFDANLRADSHARAEAAHGEEIKMVVEWAEAVATHAGISLNLGQPLLR